MLYMKSRVYLYSPFSCYFSARAEIAVLLLRVSSRRQRFLSRIARVEFAKLKYEHNLASAAKIGFPLELSLFAPSFSSSSLFSPATAA